jgi:hypothetical protein
MDTGREQNHSSEEFWTSPCLYTAAFLVVKGIRPKLFRENGKVLFGFPANDRLFQLLSAYSNGEEVAVMGFVQTCKHLKAQMYTLKGNGNGGHYGQRSIPR